MARKKKNLNLLEELDNYFEDVDKDSTLSVIPTGSTSLDVSLGIGGIPQSRFSEIYGSESTGKTTLALSICKKALDNGLNVLYNDAEHGLDKERISTLLGEYDKERFRWIKPENMEHSLHACELAIQSGAYNLIVLDSIGSLVPEKVKEDELTDANVALLSRTLTTFVQRNAHEIYSSDVAFLGINQVRDKIGSYFSTFETPGGHSWKHLLSIQIQLSKVSDIKVGNDKIGILSKFVIRKNKLSRPFRTFTIPIMFDTGVDSERDLIEFATTIGIIDKGGAYYIFEGNTLGQGVNNTIEYLKGNRETFDKIRDMCYNAVHNIIEDESEDKIDNE